MADARGVDPPRSLTDPGRTPGWAALPWVRWLLLRVAVPVTWFAGSVWGVRSAVGGERLPEFLLGALVLVTWAVVVDWPGPGRSRRSGKRTGGWRGVGPLLPGVVTAFLALPWPATGQPVAGLAGERSALAGLRVGWDHLPVVGLGYREAAGNGPSLAAGLRVPWVFPRTPGSWRLELGVQLPRWDGGPPGGPGISSEVKATVTHASDPTGRRLGFGVEVDVAPGFTGERWGVALEFLWRRALLTREAPSPMVQDLFRDRPGVPEPLTAAETPRVGWRRGGVVQLGLGGRGTLLLGDGTVLEVSGGWSHHPNALGVGMNPMLGVFPFRFEVGLWERIP